MVYANILNHAVRLSTSSDYFLRQTQISTLEQGIARIASDKPERDIPELILDCRTSTAEH